MDGWMDSIGFEYIYMNLLWGGHEHGGGDINVADRQKNIKELEA